MIRSMSSALSGMRNSQTMLDVVGNNIANVSTVGFKSSTAIFSDVLTQTLLGANAPTDTAGGASAAQIGLGARLAGTMQSFTQGAIQSTGRNTDVAIQGDGFFVVNGAAGQMFTRSGALTLDANGNLTTVEGNLVQGWQGDVSGNVNTNADPGPVEIRVGDLLSPKQTSMVDLGGNLSAAAAIGYSTTLTLTGYDTQGNSTPINVQFTKSAANSWTASASYGSPGTAVTLTDAALTFDANGELTAPVDRDINIAGGQIPGFTGAISLALGGASSPGRLTQFAGATTAGIKNQDGGSAGTLQAFTINQQGVITGNYSNGRSRTIGQLAIAVFVNPVGLERVGGAWMKSPNSGEPEIGTPGSGGRGLLAWGTLEGSNVDLAEEFTRLIVAQRGFQGNARVITTADEVLQEVVNLKR
ncbi:MAG: flagellar basal-body rod protein FlgF [Actinomycetota bacterium]|jgi:flagellar hook protein FlgE